MGRLFELLEDTLHEWECDVQTETLSQIAEHLIDNGVIALPCAVGDTVYFVDEYGIGGVKEYEVGCIVLKGTGDYMQRLWQDIYGGDIGCFEDIGKTVFLTKEEAEAKLKELEGAKE